MASLSEGLKGAIFFISQVHITEGNGVFYVTNIEGAAVGFQRRKKQ